ALAGHSLFHRMGFRNLLRPRAESARPDHARLCVSGCLIWPALFVAATCVARTVGPRAWPSVLIAIVPLLVTLWLAWRRAFSPPEMVSAAGDSLLVTALRQRFPARTAV